jgi:glycosyltransferase involved in cell wall biosynthesis
MTVADGCSRALVSVVMPVRNGGRWLQAAVDSILNQASVYLELLLVDDHSSDGALKALAGDDPRLKILALPGHEQGVVAAFNHGWRHARGEYIARMDADDLALPARLATQLAMLERQPGLALVGAAVELFSDQPLAAGNRHYQRWLNSLCTAADIRRELFIESPIPNPTALFRRSTLDRLGGYRDSRWPEDYDLFLRADAAGMAMAKAPEVLLRWREHPQRLTHTDGRYSRAAFQAAKAHFLVHGRGIRSNILIWGAGPGGRLLHDLLVAEGAEVAGFVEVHPRRIGGQKRGLPVWAVDQAARWPGPLLVAVGARGARTDIRRFLSEQQRIEGRDYLFVL